MIDRALTFSLAACVGFVSCRTPEPPKTTTLQTSTTPVVTKLEPPTSIATTKLESSSNSPTTTTTVQQALTDLQAQRTKDGLLINLPENILFDFDKSELRPNAKPTLQKLSVLLKNYQTAPVGINGHTDSKGSDEYNQDLSNRRAEAVKTYLVQNFALEGDRLTTKGFGKTQPIVPNTKPNGADDPDGRQKNRRVEVIIRSTAP